MNSRSVYLLVLTIYLAACGNKDSQQKIFYLNSYHQGYGSSDDVERGIRETLSGKPVDLEVFYLDTKRNPEPAKIREKVEEALVAIEKFNPDVILASDDNAVKFVIEPHFKNGQVPVVFCGVNWSAEQYGLPSQNVTGMLEVLPLRQSLANLKAMYPQSSKLLVLSENTTSEQKNKSLLDSLYQEVGFQADYALVDDFEAWKQSFEEGNQQADLIYFSTNGAIKNWNDTVAIEFIRENIQKPVFTCDDFMMKYAVYGLTKIAEEQGEWAANQALEILAGKEPSEIPLSRNQQTKAWLNPVLAEKIDFVLPDSLREKTTVITDFDDL